MQAQAFKDQHGDNYFAIMRAGATIHRDANQNPQSWELTFPDGSQYRGAWMRSCTGNRYSNSTVIPPGRYTYSCATGNWVPAY